MKRSKKSFAPPNSTLQNSSPVTLRIGNNLANRYMAFGDSITEGDSRRGNHAYRRRLQGMLEGHFGIAEVLNSGASGTHSGQGTDRIGSELAANHPAIVLIVYGTNDWNSCLLPGRCFTVESLRTIIREVRSVSSLPFVCLSSALCWSPSKF